MFFPSLTKLRAIEDLQAEPTLLITPAAFEVVFVSDGETWSLWVLTAGAVEADETHVLPLDYDADDNAKHWLRTGTGTVVNNALVDSSGNILTDSNGNPLVFQ